MICRIEDQQRETEVRVDAMRQHMIQRESRHRNHSQELTAQVSDLRNTVERLVEDDRRKSEDLHKIATEKAELLEMLRSFLRQHVIKPASSSEGASNQINGNGQYEKVTLI